MMAMPSPSACSSASPAPPAPPDAAFPPERVSRMGCVFPWLALGVGVMTSGAMLPRHCH